MIREELIIYLSEVAHFLGGWRVDTRRENILYLLGENQDVRLFVNPATYRKSEKGKIFISASYPENYNGVPEYFKIGVSHRKSPETIAKDIKKRLLCHYLPELKKVQNYIIEEANQRETISHIESMVKNVGLDRFYKSDHKSCTQRSCINLSNNKMDINLEINRAGISDLSIHNLDPEQLVKICYFIKTLK